MRKMPINMTALSRVVEWANNEGGVSQDVSSLFLIFHRCLSLKKICSVRNNILRSNLASTLCSVHPVGHSGPILTMRNDLTIAKRFLTWFSTQTNFGPIYDSSQPIFKMSPDHKLTGLSGPPVQISPWMARFNTGRHSCSLFNQSFIRVQPMETVFNLNPGQSTL